MSSRGDRTGKSEHTLFASGPFVTNVACLEGGTSRRWLLAFGLAYQLRLSILPVVLATRTLIFQPNV
jgi:hypothetical protein